MELLSPDGQVIDWVTEVNGVSVTDNPLRRFNEGEYKSRNSLCYGYAVPETNWKKEFLGKEFNDNIYPAHLQYFDIEKILAVYSTTLCISII